MDELFKKQNKIQFVKGIKEVKDKEIDGFTVYEKETEEKEFFKAGKNKKIKWTVDKLLAEKMESDPEIKDIFLNDKDAEEYYKQNNKFSSKDRKKSMKKCLEIRENKLKDTAGKLKNKEKPTLSEQIETKKKLIELDAQAREEYVKATMVNDNDYKTDITVNRMRKLFRLGRLYSEYLQSAEDLPVGLKIELDKKLEDVRAELQKEIDNMRESDIGKITWEKISGEKQYKASSMQKFFADAEEKAEEKKYEEEQKAKEKKAEERKAAQKKLAEQRKKATQEDSDNEESGEVMSENRMYMIRTGKLGKKQEEKIKGTEWVIGRYADLAAQVFAGREKMSDDKFARELINYNNVLKSNLNQLEKEIYNNKAYSDVTLNLKVLKSRLMNTTAEKMGKSLFDKGAVKNLAPETIKSYVDKEQIAKYRERKEKLEKDEVLALSTRGEDIWDSKALQSLVVGDEVSEKQMDALRSQVKNLSNMIDGIVKFKFGVLISDEVYADVLKYLGDNALFGNYEKVANAVGQYVDTMQFTNRKAAAVKRDFQRAYESEIDPVCFVFRAEFTETVEKYMAKKRKVWDARGVDRRAVMKRELVSVKKYLSKVNKVTMDEKLSNEGWNKLMDKCRDYITNVLGGAMLYTRGIYADTEEVLKKNIADIKEWEKKEGKTDKVAKLDYQRFAETARRDKGIRKADFSYGTRLKSDEVIGSESWRAILNDEEIDFVRDNFDQIVLGNEKLKEECPFLNDFKGLDQFGDLSAEQFEVLKKSVSALLTKENVKETIEELRANKDCDAELRKKAILKMLETSSGASVMKEYVDKELKIRSDAKKAEEAKTTEQRRYNLLKAPKKRDGKIHYAFTDMKGHDKSALDKRFSTRGNWLLEREKSFDKANAFWATVDKLDDALKEKVKFSIDWTMARLKPENHLEELAKSLKEITGVAVDDCVTELLMYRNQDLLFSHGGPAQDTFFEYNEKKYKRKMIALSKQVKINTDKLENDLKDYPEEVRNELREKLLPIYLTFSTKEQDTVAELEKEVKILENTLKEEKDSKLKEKTESKLKALKTKLNAAKGSAKGEIANNKKKTGYENSEDLAKLYKSEVSVSDGSMNEEMSQMAELLEKRKEMLSNYGNSDLKPIADWLFDQVDVRKALLDPAESVAQKKIEELHTNLASFMNVYNTQFTVIRQLYLEKHAKNLTTLKKPKTEKDWAGEFEKFTTSYVTTGSDKLNSIEKNFKIIDEKLTDAFEKYYFDSDAVKAELKRDKKSNMNPSARYNKARLFARGAVATIGYYIRNDEELFEKTYNERSVNELAKQIGENYMANEKETERVFRAYLAKNKAVASADIESDLQLFLSHVRVYAIKENKADYKKHIKKYLSDYVSGVKITTFAHTALIKQSEKRLAEKNALLQPLKDELTKRSAETREAVDGVLFGGNLNSINQFASQKRSLAYEHSKSNKQIKTKGVEEDTRLRAAAKTALEKVSNGKAVPEILVNILDEYTRFNSGILDMVDRAADWVLREKNEIVLEAERLVKVYEYGKEQGIPEAGLELYTVYAVRNSERGYDSGMKDAAKHFKEFYAKFSELEGVAVSNPIVKAQKKDAMEKLRMLLFIKGESLTKEQTEKIVDAQKAYFERADKAYKLIYEAAGEDSYISKRDKVYKEVFIKGACDYVGAELINGAAAGTAFDEAAFKEKIKALFADKLQREAFITRTKSVSSEKFEVTHSFEGSLTKKDFEKNVVRMNEPTLLKAYNGLNEKQKEMLAIALYTMRVEDTGTMSVLYGEHANELKANRNLMSKYIRGEKVSFEVDYGRAIRAFDIRQTDSKDMYDKELFREAYDFVQQIEKRKTVAKKKDWAKIGNSEESVKSAIRLGAKSADAKNYEKATLTSTTKAGFLTNLNKFALSDIKKQQSQNIIDVVKTGINEYKQNSNIDNVMNRVSSLQSHQQRLLIYILQDRTALDYSSGGRGQDSKIWGFANDVKRAALIDRLKSPDEKQKAIEDATSPDMIRMAMATLMSYQIKDHEDISDGQLSKGDFVSGALDRIEVIDWALLSRAIDLLDEIEGEQRRLIAVRQASKWLTDDLDKSDNSEAKKAYRKHKDAMKLSGRDKFEQFFIETGRYDAAANGANSEDIDTLLEGYLSLSDEEKALFVRALEHRDILDVSQKNMYRSFLGTAEREFVNAKGRDELIDEFLETTYGAEGHVNLKEDSYEKAFVSLLTTQVNDDMNFAKAKGLDWTNKNMYTNNQIFVAKRNTAIDWNLFREALKFVHTTVAERDQARGDEEIYRSMGNVSEHGRMNFDRSFMRSNLKRTGNRIIRKITQIGVGEAVANIPYIDKVLELEDIIDQVAPVKTSNYIHQYVGEFKKFQGKYERLWEEKKEEEAKKADEKKEDAAEDPYELKFLNNLGKLVDLGRSNIDTAKNIKKEIKDKYVDTKEFFLGKKEAEQDELSNALKELGGKVDPLKLERNDFLDRAKRDFIQKSKDLTHYDKLLKQKDEFIERFGEVKKEVIEGNVVYKTYKKTEGLADDLVKEYKQEVFEEYIDGTKPYKAYSSVMKYGKTAKEYYGVVNGFINNNDFVKKIVDEYVINKITNSYCAQKVTEWYDAGADWVSDKVDSVKNFMMSTEPVKLVTGAQEKMGELKEKYVDGTIDKVTGLYTEGKEKIDELRKKATHFVLEDMIPDEVKNALDKIVNAASKSQEFLDKAQKFVSEKLALIDTFKDYYNIGKSIYEAGKNIHTLNKSKDEALEKHESDVEKVDETMENRDEEQEEVVRQHQQTTIDLLLKSNSLTKYAQGRKIAVKSGEMASKIMSNFAPTKVVAKVLPVAIEMATFMSQCLTDHNALIKWYDGPGQATVKKIFAGQERLKAYEDSKKLETLDEKISVKEEKLPMLDDMIKTDDPDAKIAVDRKVLSKIKYAMGFTREEELMDFLGLKMVDSLLFAASNYNPLEEPQVLAKCTLTVLGLDDCIGKTDSDTAMKVFKALKK